MVMKQPIGWSQPILIHKLDDGDQFLQAILQRRAREHDGIGRDDFFDGASGTRIPVLDPLSLVQYDQVGRPAPDQVQVAMDGVVIGDLEETRIGELLLSARPKTANHLRGPADELIDFPLPLVLERSRADDQDALYAKEAGHDFRGRNGLDGFAETHLITDQTPAGAGREQRPLALVIIEREAQQLLEKRAAKAALESLG